MSAIPRGGSPVVGAIFDFVKTRRLQPGDRLPSERDFAERLQIGRNAVREAMATLIALRVVESRRNSGIYLRRYDKDSSFEALVMLSSMGAAPDGTEIEETMVVRAQLELLSVELACARRTDEDLLRIEQALAATRVALAEGRSIGAQDTEFHMAIAEATHNSVLVRVLNAFYQFTAERREVMLFDPGQAHRSANEHAALLELIGTRDADGARALMTRHMTRARAYWEAVLQAEGQESEGPR